MARVCEITGKKTRFGGNKKHRRGSSGGGGAWAYKAPNTNRKWKPNLRTLKVIVNGTPKRIKISMRAYKTIRKKALQTNTVESKKSYVASN
ncbi:MAG: 50S ribosomal protein L28 [Candidatus Dojkabacteria bacterium]|nr:50S ribosomal protein L28 [Candidatus Dojkabacteria bacterium]